MFALWKQRNLEKFGSGEEETQHRAKELLFPRVRRICLMREELTETDQRMIPAQEVLWGRTATDLKIWLDRTEPAVARAIQEKLGVIRRTPDIRQYFEEQDPEYIPDDGEGSTVFSEESRESWDSGESTPADPDWPGGDDLNGVTESETRMQELIFQLDGWDSAESETE